MKEEKRKAGRPKKAGNIKPEKNQTRDEQKTGSYVFSQIEENNNASFFCQLRHITQLMHETGAPSTNSLSNITCDGNKITAQVMPEDRIINHYGTKAYLELTRRRNLIRGFGEAIERATKNTNIAIEREKEINHQPYADIITWKITFNNHTKGTNQ